MRSYVAEFLGAFFVVFTALSTAAVSPVLCALSVGAVVVACIWVGAHISGAHFNPAVTFAVYLRGGLSLLDLWSYWAAQLGGAFVAAVAGLAVSPVSGSGFDVSVPTELMPAMLVEFLFTFALVYVVLSVGPSRHQEKNVFYGLAVGLVVLAGILTVSGISGAAFNPAVAFGMTVDGEFAWQAIWVYVGAELCGAVAAAGVMSRVRVD